MATAEEIKKLFPDYFAKNYRGQLNEDIIQKILKLYEEEKIGSVRISEKLLKENKLNINQGVIGRILTKARANNIVKTIPKKELTPTNPRLYENIADRKINNVVREITPLDRKQRNIPKDAKYKIVFATPQGKTTKIPKEFIGVKYFNTKAEADTALNKRLNKDFKTVADPNAARIQRSRKRAANEKAVTKLSSAADKANIKAIEGGISEINKYFKKDPDLINTTSFGKNIKAMMSLRLDKDTGNFYSKLRPDSYYLDKAKEGQLFDLFDINPVAGKKPGGRFATNVNISPNQFNRAFVGSQLSNFFNKGVNQETASQLNSILKERNIRVDLPNVGKVGASGGDVAFDSKTGSFPRIVKTLETMEAPDKILNLFKDTYKNAPEGAPIVKYLEKEVAKCAKGCFIKVANKNPEKIKNKLMSDPKIVNLIEGGALTTANKIPQPPVKTEVENIKAVNEFNRRNPRINQTPPIVPNTRYDPNAGGFVNTKTNTIDNNFNAKAYAENNPVEVKAGTEDALKPIKGNLLKTVGKSLAYVGAPLPTALIDSYFVGKQISEDRPAAEIAKDPLNWLGLATMSTLSNISGVTKPGKVNAALRLGMSPGLIRGVSRFAGIPGLAISTALTAYDQYNKYKNEEGLVYNLFNDKAKAV
jgi:hypothetical protein